MNTSLRVDAGGPAAASPHVSWPAKVDVLGVGVSVTDYEAAANTVIDAAGRRSGGVVSCHPVSGIISAAADPVLMQRVNQFEMITPDGQPVRWAMNWLHRVGMRERVYGPQLMLTVCRKAAEAGVGVYLYGSTDTVIERLETNLRERFPGLIIAGAEAPPFRPLAPEEDAAMVQRVNASGAGVLFLGLGCPKQDHFAYEHRDRIEAVQLCVGAAFDFHAGLKKTAPAWMQSRGLEWLFRLSQEPGRLWRRYLVMNTLFAVKLSAAVVRRKVAGPPAPAR
jgi:exopolysaccharide biosynthesis WecB/TagA/CpsF family protein